MDKKYDKILSSYSNCINIPSCESCKAWESIEGSDTTWCEFLREHDQEIREKIYKILEG